MLIVLLKCLRAGTSDQCRKVLPIGIHPIYVDLGWKDLSFWKIYDFVFRISLILLTGLPRKRRMFADKVFVNSEWVVSTPVWDQADGVVVI